MIEYCPEHTKVIESLGRIENKIDNAKTQVENLSLRLNGSFDKMTDHIKDGEYYRQRVQVHDYKMKLMTWVFGSVNVAILVALIRLFVG